MSLGFASRCLGKASGVVGFASRCLGKASGVCIMYYTAFNTCKNSAKKGVIKTIKVINLAVYKIKDNQRF